MNDSCKLIGIFAPFLTGLVLCAAGIGSAYLLRARYDIHQIAEERGAAGLLLIAMIGSFVFALIASVIGAYMMIVCWVMPS